MPLRLIVLAALVLAAPASARAPAAVARSADERAVLAADARQRDAVANVDLAAIKAIAHPNLRINAPSNRILSGEDLVRMVGSGEIRNEVFERVAETVTVTGDVGVVMGRETVLPGAASEQARMYGRKTLNRRYTNVYLREGGAWRHLARHANIMAEAKPPAGK
ncbi:MAG TPA: nuclear transport factor 2 family protein [Allosphingosinicella sp.]|nr:nuclear transport factor 2 family protein [Allosphingosinicella sp.]